MTGFPHTFLSNDKSRITKKVCGIASSLHPHPRCCTFLCTNQSLASNTAIRAMVYCASARILGAVLAEARSTDLRRLNREGSPERFSRS